MPFLHLSSFWFFMRAISWPHRPPLNLLLQCSSTTSWRHDALGHLVSGHRLLLPFHSPNHSKWLIPDTRLFNFDASSSCLCDKHWGFFWRVMFFCWDNGAISSSKIIFGTAVFMLHLKLRRDGCVLIVSLNGPQGLRTLVFWRRALTVNYRKIFPRCPKWCPTISSCFGYIFVLFLNLTNLFFPAGCCLKPPRVSPTDLPGASSMAQHSSVGGDIGVYFIQLGELQKKLKYP